MRQREPVKPAVLVVDNDEALTRALTLRLEDAGYIAHAAHSGLQGLSVFKAFPIDLIITDLNMSGGGGAALVERVREMSDLPIVVLTGFLDELRKGVRGKRVFLLRKPYEAQALMDLVEMELIRRQKHAA